MSNHISYSGPLSDSRPRFRRTDQTYVDNGTLPPFTMIIGSMYLYLDFETLDSLAHQSVMMRDEYLAEITCGLCNKPKGDNPDEWIVEEQAHVACLEAHRKAQASAFAEWEV